MSEKLHPSQEKGSENLDLSEKSRQNLERLQRAAQEAEHHKDTVEEMGAKVKEQAVSAKETTVGENAEDKPQTDYGNRRELKRQAYQQTMSRIRQGLRPSERIFSKTIHQPVVNNVSEVSAKTIGRPMGIIGGGLLALFGSIVLLYGAKHYGYRYNFLFFFGLFVIGYLVTTVFELGLHLIKSKAH